MLVTIAIPTYNRCAQLRRAIDSALAQTHRSIEVVVCDNASEDGTEELCRSIVARDRRVRYVRHARNLGPTANFNALFAECRGDFVLALADDDWLDDRYVAACLEALLTAPGTAIAAGRARYHRDDRVVAEGVVHTHLQLEARDRVLAYLATVDDNGVFYGLVPRAVLNRAWPLPNVLGNDWLHVARIVYQGTAVMLDDVHIDRELGGTSSDVGSILETFGSAGWQRRVPQLVIAYQIFRDIAWAHPLYADLGRARWRLGADAALVSIRWRDLAWHLITPPVHALSRRPRGRQVWRAYDWLTRAVGAGRRP